MTSSPKHSEWWQRGIDALREVGVDVEVAGNGPFDPESNPQIDVVVRGMRTRLCVEYRAQGYPRDMRAVVAQRSGESQSSCLVLIAVPYITKTARTYLRDNGISYLDGTGSFYLNLPGALLLIDSGARAEQEHGRKNLFQSVSSQVLHALLIEPERTWSVADLAAVSAASPGTVHGVFTKLEQLGWMRREGSGPRTRRTLVEPGMLLDAWAAVHELSSYQWHRFHLWRSDPDAILDVVVSALDRFDIDYALTLSTGAELVMPSAASDRVTYVLVPQGNTIHDCMISVGAKAVDEGGNIALLTTGNRSPFQFTQAIDGRLVASDIQLYLDLFDWPRRGKEQAVRLREERIGF